MSGMCFYLDIFHNIMSAGIVCVKVGEIFTIFKVFPLLLSSFFFLLSSSLPSLYNTDATGHDIMSNFVQLF